MNWQDITAVFGGRFDPPHLGHREAIRGLFLLPKVKRVMVLPSAVPPHKPCSTPVDDRLAMLRLNVAFEPGTCAGHVVIDAREIERAKRTGQPGYTFDTLQELRQEAPRLAFVMGADQFDQMPQTWYRFPDVLDLAHWIILMRRPNGAEIAREAFQRWQGNGWIRPLSDHEWLTRGGTVIGLFPTEAPEVSSTVIREELARTGNVTSGQLLPSVEEYIHQHRLYGASPI